MTEAAIATETARQRAQKAEVAQTLAEATKARQNACKRFAAIKEDQ